jgi:hypothetical protein
MGIRTFLNSNSAAAKIARILATAVGVLITMIVQYVAISKGVAAVAKVWETVASALGLTTVAEEGATAAQWGLNAAMDANPVGVVILALEAFAALLIFLVKKFQPVGDVIVWFFKLWGTVAGKELAIGVKAIEYYGIAIINVVRLYVKAEQILTNNRFFKILYGSGAANLGKSALKTLDDFEAKFKEVADGISTTAWNKGGDIGEKLGKGLVNTIKNLKLPKFALPPDTNTDPNANPTPLPKDPAKAAKMITKFWTDKLKLAKQALDVVKKAADDAAQDYKKTSESIADSISKGFDITGMFESSFAKYLGANVLVDSFRRKLADAKEFVADLKILGNAGLPHAMLLQIANAGPDGGLETARMLVGNTSIIADLKNIDADITSASLEAGTTVADAVHGTTVATTAKAVETPQSNMDTTFTGATRAGVDTSGYQSDVTPSVVVNVMAETNADPAAIAAHVTRAVKTRAPAGKATGKHKPPSHPYPSLGTGKRSAII